MLLFILQGVVVNFMASMETDMAAAEAGLKAAQAVYRQASTFLNGKGDKTDSRLVADMRFIHKISHLQQHNALVV